MSVSQVSVFVESRPGHLSRILEAFEAARVNVCGLSAADTGDCGIVRFVVDDPDAALSVLRERGAACSRSEVLCIRLEDRPGELARLMGVLARVGINISYCYSTISTYVVVSVKDVAEAERLIIEEGSLELASQDDLAAPGAGGEVR